ACPREMGGEEADPVTQLEVWEALARIDASTSWVVGILGCSSFMAAYLPAQSTQRIFATGVPPMVGVPLPRGQAEPFDGGYRVKGRWSFGSSFTSRSGSSRARACQDRRPWRELVSSCCHEIRSQSTTTGRSLDSELRGAVTTVRRTCSCRAR